MKIINTIIGIIQAPAKIKALACAVRDLCIQSNNYQETLLEMQRVMLEGILENDIDARAKKFGPLLTKTKSLIEQSEAHRRDADAVIGKFETAFGISSKKH